MPNKPKTTPLGQKTSFNNLKISGARVHNLKNVNLEIPKNKLVVITGLSGSGKSSLAFDTIYAEGQRRYAESLSAYARQFMELRDKPDVDKIVGLSPTIAVDQKQNAQNPRSTVGTATEIYDYLRLLFANAGVQYCTHCGEKVEKYTTGEIIENARKFIRQEKEAYILSPIAQSSEINKKEILEIVEKSGFDQVRVNGKFLRIHDFANFEFVKKELYDVELVIEKIDNIKKQDITKAVNTAIDLSNGTVILSSEKEQKRYSIFGWCSKCKEKFPKIDLRSFSFNSPYGACPRCTGLGITMVVDSKLVVPNPRLTLAEGAIQPWTRITGNQSWYQKLLKAVSEKHGFSLNQSIEKMKSEVFDLILYGTGDEEYEVNGKTVVFSGVVSDLTNRHLETKSDYIRKEIETYMREKTCPVCEGRRLKLDSLAVRYEDYGIADFSLFSIDEALEVFQGRLSEIENKIKKKTTLSKLEKISEPILRELVIRINGLNQVGLGYLSLNRSINTLSGGELTRVRLSSQLSAGLTGVIYVLDEPSIGLHSRDNGKLINTLKYLRDLGNSVIVVEHDAAMMEAADYIIDVGPGAGVFGGEIIAAGTLAQIKKNRNSITAEYLSGRVRLEKKKKKSGGKKKEVVKKIKIIGAKENNLKNINVEIPLKKLVCVSGVSGSGKSSLVIDILGRALTKHFYRAKAEPGLHKAINGISNINKVIAIDQSPIGRTPRSNPATYTGLFTLIRDLFANLPEAKMRRYDAGKFSFNVKGGGRCEACAGEGYIRIPMQFLTDVYVECGECEGTRYNKEVLEIHYKQKNISDVLEMTVEEAHRFFADKPNIAVKLNILREVGLGYVKLGQPATTLSGGEAQRVKLATELSRASTGKTLYILDEPTTGLHFEDVRHLLGVLERLVEKGNTVVVIEHNLDMIACSDWVIDMGPEGGKKGGLVLAEGTPEEVAKNKNSVTGKFLIPLLKK